MFHCINIVKYELGFKYFGYNNNNNRLLVCCDGKAENADEEGTVRFSRLFGLS